MSQKSYNNKNSVYLIPTPIGNMEDITIRALNTLKEVDVIFSEDTRVTRSLLDYYDIKKTLIANHEYNEKENSEKLLNYLNDGKNVGVVTDRGTPIISDPGYNIVTNAIEHNYNVISLPGATALIPALTVSGISPSPFLFYGFLNSKKSKRIHELEELSLNKYTMIFYESPHRIMDTLNDMLDILGNRKISISREISKKYEEIYRGTIKEVMKELEIKGEFVIVVSGNNNDINFDDITIEEHINQYLKNDINLKDAIKKVALDRNMSKKEVYNIYHKIGDNN